MAKTNLVQSVMLPLSKIESNRGQIDGLPKNPRLIRDEKFNKLKKSIEEDIEMTALRELLVIEHDGKYVIIGGNMRFRAMQDLGIKEAPCKVIPADTDVEKLKAYTIKDNAGFGEWDWDDLANEWGDEPLSDWGVDVWQAEEQEEESTEGNAEEDDFNKDSDTIVCRCARGDVWQLGSHRVMCGDSTNEKDVEKLRGGEFADLVFTDPPYGFSKADIANDNLNNEDLLEFNKRWIPLSLASLKAVGSWYCWGVDEVLMDIYSNILRPLKKEKKDNKIVFRNLITWDKGKGGMGVGVSTMRCYFPNEEKCLFVMKGGQEYGANKDDYWEGFEPIRLHLNAEREKAGLSIKQVCALTSTYASHFFSQSQWAMITKEAWDALKIYCEQRGIDAFREEYDKIREEYNKIREEWYKTRAFFDNTHDNMTSVWRFGVTTQTEREDCGGHSTPKPIALCERAIKSSSREEDVVLDLFGGSGSTLIACEQLGRRCLMMEYDTHYCDVIIARWEKLTGKTAVKIE